MPAGREMGPACERDWYSATRSATSPYNQAGFDPTQRGTRSDSFGAGRGILQDRLTRVSAELPGHRSVGRVPLLEPVRRWNGARSPRRGPKGTFHNATGRCAVALDSDSGAGSIWVHLPQESSPDGVTPGDPIWGHQPTKG